MSYADMLGPVFGGIGEGFDFGGLGEPSNYVMEGAGPWTGSLGGGGLPGVSMGGGNSFDFSKFLPSGSQMGGVIAGLTPAFASLGTGLIGRAAFPDQRGKSRTADLRNPEQVQAEQMRLNRATTTGQQLQNAEQDPYYGTLGPEATDIRTRRLRQQMMDTAGAAGQGGWSGTGDRINQRLTEDLGMQNQQREEALNRLRSQFSTLTSGYQPGFTQTQPGRPSGFGQIFGQTVVPGVGDAVADMLGVRRPGQRTINLNGQQVTVG
jgi:hypothetical protein